MVPGRVAPVERRARSQSLGMPPFARAESEPALSPKEPLFSPSGASESAQSVFFQQQPSFGGNAAASQATSLRMRRRALSECGRQLLVQVYNGVKEEKSLMLAPAVMPIELADLNSKSRVPRSRGDETRGNHERRKRSKKDSMEKEHSDQTGNYFAVMMSSDEEENDVVVPNRIESVMTSPRHISVPTGIAIDKIDESVIGEDEEEMEQWETVSNRSRNRKKQDSRLRQVRRRSNSPEGENLSAYSDDGDDLYDLQVPTFAQRQHGKFKKSMQHKVMEQRMYSIEKRNRQRQASRKPQ